MCKRLSLVCGLEKETGKLATGKHTILVGSPGEAQVKHILNVRLASIAEVREAF